MRRQAKRSEFGGPLRNGRPAGGSVRCSRYACWRLCCASGNSAAHRSCTSIQALTWAKAASWPAPRSAPPTPGFTPLPGSSGNPLARVVQAVEEGTAGHPPDLAKPGHSILLALPILLLGPTTLAAGLVPALAGIGTVLLTYAIGATGWSRRVGVVAAVLLAISAEHLVYSREPLVESTGLFFATLAGFVYLRRLVEPDSHGVRSLLAVGALVGLAFACNNRLLYLPLFFGCLELVYAWRDCTVGRLRAIALREAALAAGCLLPILVIECVFLASQAMGAAFGATPGFLDYAHQFVNFMRMNPASRTRLDQWPTFFADLGLMDGLRLWRRC